MVCWYLKVQVFSFLHIVKILIRISPGFSLRTTQTSCTGTYIRRCIVLCTTYFVHPLSQDFGWRLFVDMCHTLLVSVRSSWPCSLFTPSCWLQRYLLQVPVYSFCLQLDLSSLKGTYFLPAHVRMYLLGTLPSAGVLGGIPPGQYVPNLLVLNNYSVPFRLAHAYILGSRSYSKTALLEYLYAHTPSFQCNICNTLCNL